MRPICLTQGKIAVVDDADYARLSKYNWYAHKGRYGFYAMRMSPRDKDGKQIMIAMHRQILGLEKGDSREVDHRNHNTLDNRRDNIWACTHAQNQRNRKYKKS